MNDARSGKPSSSGAQESDPVSIPQPGGLVDAALASEQTERERLMRRFAAAEELSWGGRGEREPEPRAAGENSLPDSWVDVTNIVLPQLEAVRAAGSAGQA